MSHLLYTSHSSMHSFTSLTNLLHNIRQRLPRYQPPHHHSTLQALLTLQYTEEDSQGHLHQDLVPPVRLEQIHHLLPLQNSSEVLASPANQFTCPKQVLLALEQEGKVLDTELRKLSTREEEAPSFWSYQMNTIVLLD